MTKVHEAQVETKKFETENPGMHFVVKVLNQVFLPEPTGVCCIE